MAKVIHLLFDFVFFVILYLFFYAVSELMQVQADVGVVLVQQHWGF